MWRKVPLHDVIPWEGLLFLLGFLHKKKKFMDMSRN